MNTIRASFGVKCEVFKNHTLGMYYLRQWDDIGSAASQTNIVQLTYKINLK